jgi:peptidoglycan/LPS O-acetylase OafA/YrhL
VPFRGEIHGLRALAILLVAIYHIWFGRVSGGVDVFLFISAFLLTGTFARRLESGRPLAIGRYWLKTFKRLLPPASIAILGSLVIALTVLPPTAWDTIRRHAWASVLYVQNYVLAADGVDYYNHDAAAASPLQHFWSMSIQGQIFLLWPLLFAAGALLLRIPALYRRPRRTMAGVFGLILVASLVWSIHETATNQTIAYFDSAARVWEFASGSLLGLLLPRIEEWTGATRRTDARPRFAVVRGIAGWIGVAGLLSCGMLLDVAGMFPGWIALWPLASAGLVITAGRSCLRWGADRFLSLRPVAFLGSIAYALYLVHWPLLIGWLGITDQERAGVWDGLGVLAVSILVAWALTWLVDTPIRRSAWIEEKAWRPAGVIAVCLAVVLIAGQVLFPMAERSVLGIPTGTGPDRAGSIASDGSGASDGGDATPVMGPHPGAQWQDDPLTDGSGAPIPGPDELGPPRDELPEDCQGDYGPSDGFFCRYAPAKVPPTGDQKPLTILLAGDSHAEQYATGVMRAAEDRPWTVYYVGYSGCDFGPHPDKDSCADADASWQRALDGIDPDLVLTVGSHSPEKGTDETDRPALDEGLRYTATRGIPVLLLRDNPRWPDADPRYDCTFDVIRDDGDAARADRKCGADMADKLADEDPAAHRASDDPYAPVVLADPSADVLCPDGRCLPMMGNVFVYRDADHLNGTFTTTMAPWLTEQIDRTLEAKTQDTPPASDGGGASDGGASDGDS